MSRDGMHTDGQKHVYLVILAFDFFHLKTALGVTSNMGNL